MIVRESFDFIGSIVCAVTASPTFNFFESSPEVSSAKIAVPAANVASVCSLRTAAAGASCANVGVTFNPPNAKAAAAAAAPPINRNRIVPTSLQAWNNSTQSVLFAFDEIPNKKGADT